MSDYHAQDWKSVIKKQKTSLKGLSNKEVEKRINKHGLNKLEKEKPLSAFLILISQFKSPLIYVLLVAGLVSLLLGETVDALVIFVAVFINTIIGFFQENKANKSLSKLREMVQHKTLVFREGKEKGVDSENIVPGDIVVLQPGNRVPADIRIIESNDLQVNEASLTGESVASFKKSRKIKESTPLADRDNMVYASTVVVSGTAKGVVVETGAKTEIGKISSLIGSTKEEATPLQSRLLKLSKFLGLVALAVCVLIIIVGLIQGRELFEMFIIGVAIAVSAIPEGLVVAVTVILVLGMQQILKKKALTRKLIAAETLGSVTVICSDKTGTLTQGKMKVDSFVLNNKKIDLKKIEIKKIDEDIELALKISALCNNAIIEDYKVDVKDLKILGLATEVALLQNSANFFVNIEELNNDYSRLAELPFSSATKFMATLNKKGNEYYLFEKGAPERVLEKSSFYFHEDKIKKIDNSYRKELDENYKKLTKKGLRLIALAYKKIDKREVNKFDKECLEKQDKDLVFVGFAALKDPLRPEAKETISICRRAGIRPVIITGDHKLTASAIAKEVGFDVKNTSIMSGDELDKIDDKELKKVVEDIDIFARVSPNHKLRIVKALQKNGEVVAMTGDGINDSPALKAADIGVCLGSGTDIAKETADIVLLDDNFSVIVSAVKQGRIIFSNIQKVITYLISDSFSEAVLIVGAIILGLPLPILPVQILWINIVNDGLPNFSLAFEKEDDGIMERKPISKKKHIINKEMRTIIFLAGTIRDIFYFIIFFYFLGIDANIEHIRTMIFAIVGVDSLIYVFSLRSLLKPIWKMNPFSNKYLIFATIGSFLLLLSSIYIPFLQKALKTVPLSLSDWGIVFIVSIIAMSFVEISKYFFIVKDRKARQKI
ncbi:HAD family hydrolase [bacterium]|nr:HAD family hydrolase [bacterium]